MGIARHYVLTISSGSACLCVCKWNMLKISASGTSGRSLRQCEHTRCPCVVPLKDFQGQNHSIIETKAVRSFGGFFFFFFEKIRQVIFSVYLLGSAPKEGKPLSESH